MRNFCSLLSILVLLNDNVIPLVDCSSEEKVYTDQEYEYLGNESRFPTVTPFPSISPAPTITPTANSTENGNSTVSPAPSVSLAPTEATGNNTSPTPAPSSNATTIAPATPEPTTMAPTAPEAAPTSAPTAEPTDDHEHNHKKHHMSFLRIIGKTIALLILMAFALLGFGACMSNRYRIYYYARNSWYAFLRLGTTQWVIQKLRLDRIFGDSISNPHDYTSLNDIIFDEDHGFLMSET